ncbi:hypothetical protein EV385_5796 [Krasilnikovia cinnamomea]|uniref:Uncharacterized protein n=1 Tax=Krasilnikovia cinnamomea TaxID=349313 RepID=A0A4Q7ZRT6_9ACTN|nr:hypothetical protein EV385_5796 [Krasilnikovia cinnamomea]
MGFNHDATHGMNPTPAADNLPGEPTGHQAPSRPRTPCLPSAPAGQNARLVTVNGRYPMLDALTDRPAKNQVTHLVSDRLITSS